MYDRDNFFQNFIMPNKSDIVNKNDAQVRNIYENFKDEEYDPTVNYPYYQIERKNKYNPLSQLAGLSPLENNYQTEVNKLNKDMSLINKDKDTREEFYRKVKENNKRDIELMNKTNKRDHIKGIFSTLNFGRKPTSYTDSYEYTTQKKKSTIDHEFDNHYQKSFMKTYEENKIAHQIILRK